MQGRLQQTYRVAGELDRNAVFSGVIPVTKMPRLSSLIIENDAEITVQFEFATDRFQHPSIRGHYQVDLTAECQRCLEPMVYPVDQSFELLIDATDEDIEAFQVDSVYSVDGYVDIHEVIEDELILDLPIILMHEDRGCNKYLQPETSESQVAERENPFAVLESLKGGD